eukprot:m.79516 g.79516  ORF g.79516 m.79516 type:complete len:228 (+) comp9297_c0_seq1:131-814(+)
MDAAGGASSAAPTKKKAGKGPLDPDYLRLKKTVEVWWAQRKNSFNRHSFWRPKHALRQFREDFGERVHHAKLPQWFPQILTRLIAATEGQPTPSAGQRKRKHTASTDDVSLTGDGKKGEDTSPIKLESGSAGPADDTADDDERDNETNTVTAATSAHGSEGGVDDEDMTAIVKKKKKVKKDTKEKKKKSEKDSKKIKEEPTDDARKDAVEESPTKKRRRHKKSAKKE